MIISVKDLPKLREKNKKKTVVFVGGVFDVFHPGHVRAFKKLRAYGDIVVVGIASDKRVKELKGSKRPILSEQERREIVDAIKYVDFVVQMSDPSKSAPIPGMSVLKSLRPDTFVTIDKGWAKHRRDIESLGTTLKIVKRIHPSSSTSIIERILRKYKG